MTFNSDLAERVLAQIKDHPETWNQDHYGWQTECGTTFCFAGWACELSGMPLTFNGQIGTRLGSTGQTAGLLLGLGDQRQTALFGCETDLDQIGELVKHFANNPDDDSLPADES